MDAGLAPHAESLTDPSPFIRSGRAAEFLRAGFQVEELPGAWSCADPDDVETLVDRYTAPAPRRPDPAPAPVAAWQSPGGRFPSGRKWEITAANVAGWLRHKFGFLFTNHKFLELLGPLDAHELSLLRLDLLRFDELPGMRDLEDDDPEAYVEAAVAYLLPGREHWGNLGLAPMDEPEPAPAPADRTERRQQRQRALVEAL